MISLTTIRFILSCIYILCNVSHVNCFAPAIGKISNNRINTRPSTTFKASILIEEETIVINQPVSNPTITEIERRRRESNENDEEYNYNDDQWEVRIYNDGLNTREHVARTLVQVTNLNEYMAYKTMMHAHHHGIATVGQYVYEIAELYNDQLKVSGLVCDIIPVE
jgi:ATP-dependent Clp protease adapter protein ClpS